MISYTKTKSVPSFMMIILAIRNLLYILYAVQDLVSIEESKQRESNHVVQEDDGEDEEEEDEEEVEDEEEEDEEEDDEDEEEDDDEEEEEEDEEDDDEDEEEEDEESEEIVEERVPTPKNANDDELDTDQETDRLLGQQYNDDNGYYEQKVRIKTNQSTLIHSSICKALMNDRHDHIYFLPLKPSFT